MKGPTKRNVRIQGYIMGPTEKILEYRASSWDQLKKHTRIQSYIKGPTENKF